LFELGLTFVPAADGLQQTNTLGALMWGRRHSEAWHATNEVIDFFDIKGVLDGLLAWAGVADITFEPSEDSVLHPGQSADVLQAGKPCGRVGRLHPEIEAKLGIEGVYVFEITAQVALSKPLRKFAGISKYPSVRRDLAVVVARSVTASTVENIVREALAGILVDFRLFDVYEGKGIDSNEKSLAIGLTFQSQNATLTDEEIGHHAQVAMSALESAVNARLR